MERTDVIRGCGPQIAEWRALVHQAGGAYSRSVLGASAEAVARLQAHAWHHCRNAPRSFRPMDMPEQKADLWACVGA
eukprot:2564964-Pyramimonas_sp.AAC.1